MTLDTLQYHLPEGGGKKIYDDWRGAETMAFQPTPRQQLVMRAVAQTLGEGIFFQKHPGQDRRPRVPALEPALAEADDGEGDESPMARPRG